MQQQRTHSCGPEPARIVPLDQEARAIEMIRRAVRDRMVPEYWTCPCGCGARRFSRMVHRSEASELP